MTGGMGDYFMESDDESPVVQRARQLAGSIRDTWQGTTNKGEVIAYGALLSLGLWAAVGVVDAVDRVPVVSQVLKLVGTSYTGWFAWRYLIFHEGRMALARDLKEARASLTAGAATAYMRAAEGARPYEHERGRPPSAPFAAQGKDATGAAKSLGDLDSTSNLRGAAEAGSAPGASSKPRSAGPAGEDE